MGEYTDDELNQHVIAHAKYFTVVQVTRGGFVRGGQNYDRHQVDTLEDAREKAKELYEGDRSKGILIYAVADFAGANGFSRPVENYPKTSGYVTRGDKIKAEKAAKAAAKQRAREARLPLGEKPSTPAPQIVETTSVRHPKGWFDADEPLFLVTED